MVGLNDYIAILIAEGVDENGNPITQVKIRTVLTCRSHMGVCAKCYGSNPVSYTHLDVYKRQAVAAAPAEDAAEEAPAAE